MRVFGKVKRLAPSIVRTPSASVSTQSSVEPQFEQLFDSKWCLEVNGDVAAAGMDPLTHFVAYGEAEGRDPNPNFSTRFYRETYMQGEAADASPLRHYLLRGRELGFDPDPGNLIHYRRLVAVQAQSYGPGQSARRRQPDACLGRTDMAGAPDPLRRYLGGCQNSGPAVWQSSLVSFAPPMWMRASYE
jgi:hypothetical protein